MHNLNIIEVFPDGVMEADTDIESVTDCFDVENEVEFDGVGLETSSVRVFVEGTIEGFKKVSKYGLG